MAVIDYTDALDAGWRIFPLHDIVITSDGKRCGCGDPECKTIGKHPRSAAWQHTQDWDDTQLAYLEDEDGTFFGNQFLDGYGIVTNTSELLVVDVDGRNGGFESAKSLQKVREKCGYIVRTGSGDGEHWYFKRPAESLGKALCTNLAQYKGIDFKSTGYVVGAYSEHESGLRYEVILGSPASVTMAPDELLGLLERKEKSYTVGDYSVDENDLAAMVNAIPNTEATTYEEWLHIGMALHNSTGGTDTGLDLWVNWSRQSNPGECVSTMADKWHGFGKSANPVTAATIAAKARENGYAAKVEFVDDTEWDDEPNVEPKQHSNAIMDHDPDPGDFSGLVGRVFEWIDSQCLFPRKHLSLAAAMQVVGNAAGLRYRVDPVYKTTLNLMTFAVADSGSGKEAVYQSASELIAAAGQSAAMHGGIKSEQELVRNIVRHQASMYMVDEFGSMLVKIGNAKAKGNASYLEAVPSEIMKIFTKANSSYLVSGDMRETIEDRIDKQIATAQKRVDDGRGGEQELDDLRADRLKINNGISAPFLSFFGITEPNSFDAAIRLDPDMLVNGFLGRALLFRESQALPLRRDKYAPMPLCDELKARLFELYAQGHDGKEFDRVRLYGDRRIINISADARKELDDVYLYWRGRGQELEHEGQGLHTITTRVWEMTIKLAGILSIPVEDTHDITVELHHVRQAHAIVRRVTDFKLSHCIAILGADSHDKEERTTGLIEGVITVIKGSPDGIGAGVIRNRNKKYGSANVNACIDHLIKNSVIEEVEYRDARNRVQKKYKLK